MNREDKYQIESERQQVLNWLLETCPDRAMRLYKHMTGQGDIRQANSVCLELIRMVIMAVNRKRV